MPSFDMIDALEQRRLISQRARYGAQTADMLGMSPPRVVPAAVSVRYESDAATNHRGYLTGLRLRRERRSVDPSRMPEASRDSFSCSTSNPRTFTTNSSPGTPLG